MTKHNFKRWIRASEINIFFCHLLKQKKNYCSLPHKFPYVHIFDAQTKRFLAHSYALKALFYGHKVEMHEKIH